MHKFLWLMLLGAMVEASEVKVAVAANVSYAMDSLIKSFNEKYPETKVQVILGSSGKLTAQIRHGAPYDLFLSANMRYPEVLHESAFTLKKPVVYAYGSLAILSVKKRNYCADIYVLEDKDVKKIAIANPKTAPYGVAAKEALNNAKLYDKLKDKLVYGESIAQTVTYAAMVTEVGLIAKSSLFSPQLSHFKEAIHWSDVDASLYTPIEQGMVLLTNAKGKSEAKAFYDFMLDVQAKKILQNFGYKVK